jgi:hypothetical protein
LQNTTIKDTKNHKNKGKKTSLNLIFKQGTKEDYVIQKQEHEMCKTNVKINFCFANICKHEHEKNMTRLWCKVVLKTNVEQTEGNMKGHIFIYIPLGT